MNMASPRKIDAGAPSPAVLVLEGIVGEVYSEESRGSLSMSTAASFAHNNGPAGSADLNGNDPISNGIADGPLVVTKALGEKDGSGFLSSIRVGAKVIDIQTEVAKHPDPLVVSTAYFFGRVILAHKQPYQPGSPDTNHLAGKCHKAMVNKIRSRLQRQKAGTLQKELYLKKAPPAVLPSIMEGVDLSELDALDGITNVCIINADNDRVIKKRGRDGAGIEVLARGGAEMIRENRKLIKSLGLNESVEDILITVQSQYHIIRPITVADQYILYLVLEKDLSNLAMARYQLRIFENQIQELT